MEPDFSGYATKAGLKCSDGRTITPEAFKHMDGMQVPLVWQHMHNNPDNILGHAILHAVDDGVRVDAYFNQTPSAQKARELVQHKDIDSLSIFANKLVEKSKQVFHGIIREVSLVLSGANPGAKIDFVRLAHGDGEFDILEDEAVIYTGLPIQHSLTEDNDGEGDGTLEHKTVREVYDSLDDETRNFVNFMVEEALKAATAKHSSDPENDEDDNKETGEGDLEHKEGSAEVKRNVFENNEGTTQPTVERHVISHDDMQGILATAARTGSLREAAEGYALKHGITNLETLFPDPKTLQDRPEFNQRRVEWVAGVLNGTRKSPFSRVKSIVADLTQDEARAKGYIKGEYKKEEWFSLTSRITTPTTVYKKQKLDRDDIVDVADFDMVAWLKAEMRMMLEEELARAILIGDGRDPGDEDKIKDPGSAAEGAGIRAIVNENELYATTVNVNIADANSDYNEVVESVLRARRYYKGTGVPTFYTTAQTLVEMLLSKDTFGRRRWNSVAELASALMVRDIIEVEVMDQEEDLLGIIVNLADYNVGADRGGEVNLFDDFDIDYNQYKYLIETRISGALVKIKSALVIRTTAAANVLIEPTAPTFNSTTGVITIPTQTGVVYKDGSAEGSTLSAGAQTALAAGASKTVVAVTTGNYYFATSEGDSWTFKRPTA